jgi:uroporphyrinogen decarboxylase
MMNARERVLAAIRRQPVDRVPTDIWATAEVMAKLRAHFGAGVDVHTALGIDGIASVGPSYSGPALPTVADGEAVDYWGMRRRRTPHAGGVYYEQSFCPLAAARSIADVEAYAWPQTDWFDYSALAEQARAAQQQQVVSCGYMAPFFFHNQLRGLEQSLMDPLLEPELTHHIIGRISDFFYAHHRRMFEAAGEWIDIAQVTDDLGGQHGPLISLDVYDTFIAPQHQRFINLCHEFDILVFHHDDGAIRPFLPRLVEMGIDVLNPIQWTCPGMDLAELKAEFGQRICFHGAVDNQDILPFGAPEDVRAEVRHCLDALASDGTGYILAPCHNLQVVSPVENIIAMYDEARRYSAAIAR